MIVNVLIVVSRQPRRDAIHVVDMYLTQMTEVNNNNNNNNGLETDGWMDGWRSNNDKRTEIPWPTDRDGTDSIANWSRDAALEIAEWAAFYIPIWIEGGPDRFGPADRQPESCPNRRCE